MNKLCYKIEVISFDSKVEGIKIHQFSSLGNYFVNSIIIETNKSLIVFDVQDEIYAKEFFKYVEKLDKPINRIIISHPHIDHYSGLPIFGDTPSFTNLNILNDFKQRKIESKYIPKFKLEQEFSIDRLNFEVANISNAHCQNHLVLWIKELSCILVGDLAQYNGHLLAYDYGSFIKALKFIQEKSKNYTTLITGHGIITTTSILEENINYLKECQKIYFTSSSIEDFDKEVREKFPHRSKIKVNLGVLLRDKVIFNKS